MVAEISDFRIPKIWVKPTEADGRHFYVVEYVDGRDLGAWLLEGLLPLSGPAEKFATRGDSNYSHAAWRILASVAEALSMLHNAGLIHGDVKPKNVLVNSRGMVKLCDFDLVYAPHAPQGENAVALGTLPYLAPEVLRGQKATAFSDQYSLAMTVVSVIQGADFFGDMPMQLSALLQGLACSKSVKENLARALAPEAQSRFETVELFMNNLGPEAFEAREL
jgi:serine/threonine protein kinase